MDDQRNENGHSAGSESEQHAKAMEFKHSGNDKFSKNDFKRAIADYKKGLLHEPNNSDLHTNLSAAYIHLEKFIEAEQHAIYAIHLRPNFYKGYMRAAKAAHGRGMTKLGLKRLAAGLAAVTDANGVKELTRLKTQYTAYMSLESNAEREMDFDSDRYQSEDDEEERCSDDEDETDGDECPLPPPGSSIVVPMEQPAPVVVPSETKESKVPKPSSVIKVEDTPKVKDIEPPKSADIEPPKSADIELPKSADIEPLKSADIEPPKPVESSKSTDPTKYITQSEKEPKIVPEKVENSKLTSSVQEQDKGKNTPEKEPDRFLELCKELTRDPELTKHVQEFKEYLKTGSEAFLSGNYRKAAEFFKAAKERVGKLTDYEIDDRQFHIIKYAHCAALIHLGSYDEVIKALQTLQEMQVYEYSIPALYIQMAKAYCKLNRFKSAQDPLEKLQEIIDNYVIFPSYTWPGTNETIQETTPNGLKSAIKELNQTCRMPHKPTAVCRYKGCLKTSTHILPSEFIHISDPDFIGFVRMICEEKCHIEFHIACWKSYKESICGIGKINDKDILGQRCLTTDCQTVGGKPSQIIVIEIIGNDGLVKSVNKLDPKIVVDPTKKTKKKKSEKKDDVEKGLKAKKTKEKKVREVKKPVAVVEEEDEPAETNIEDPVKVIQSHKEYLAQLRTINFGLEDRYWDPQFPFYGRSDESVKASAGTFLEKSGDVLEVRDAKEFLFSFFLQILTNEGPQKQSDVDELWKESAGDFCDISVVLPNSKSISELLIESTRFCQLEDYICLSDHLESAYNTVKTELTETVTFLMTGSTSLSESDPQTSTQPDSEQPVPFSDLNTESSKVETDEDESGDESEEDEDESSEEEDNVEDKLSDKYETSSATMAEEQFKDIPPICFQYLEDTEKGLTFLDMLNEISRLKNAFSSTTEQAKPVQNNEEFDENGEKIDTPSETLDTGENSSLTVVEDVGTSVGKEQASDELDDLMNDEPEAEIVFCEKLSLTDEGHEVNSSDNVMDRTEGDGSSKVEALTANLDVDSSKETLLGSGDGIATDDMPLESSDHTERNKASQSEVSTEERHIQTSPRETRDRLSQTKESDLYKDLIKKIQDLQNQLSALNKETSKLSKDLLDKEAVNKQIIIAHEKTISRLAEENREDLNMHKALLEQLKEEFSKKEMGFKQKEEGLMSKISSMKDVFAAHKTEIVTIKKERDSHLKENSELKQSLLSVTKTFKEFESNYVRLEKDMKLMVQKAQQSHLLTIKAYWERQIALLKSRSIEKITEIQSWFSMFPPAEVEDLPSWGGIRQNTLQWGDFHKKIQQIETIFQARCGEWEGKIARGEDVEDLTMEMLPTLPEEPTPLQLDKIHKEITEKYLKKISELTKLVANQQLEIEKSKDANQQIQQIMNFQMMPRMQTQSTAIGGIGLQYLYTQTMPPPVPTIPPPTSDTAKIGNANLFWPPDAQTLLNENSNSAGFTKNISVNQFDNAPFQVPITTPPPIMMPSTSAPGAGLTMPPPPIGVAHNLLKSTTGTAITEKKDSNPVEKKATKKLEASAKASSSRESTPGPAAPTPEKSKKKKKGKSESKEVPEARMATPVNSDPGFTDLDRDDGASAWSVVMPKGAVSKHVVAAPIAQPDSKLKNKKKLLDKLQMRFPTTPLKDLDDIVKLVREHNNGSLSGLPFNEIETRVERFLTKRHFQKTSTMGLVKFSESAWGTVKQQETINLKNWEVEECVICLEVVGKERTKLSCNHEFHTKCLRNWLKEKSVCPICIEFATMPDEYPAL